MMLRNLHRSVDAREPVQHDVVARRHDERPKTIRKLEALVRFMPVQNTLLEASRLRKNGKCRRDQTPRHSKARSAKKLPRLVRTRIVLPFCSKPVKQARVRVLAPWRRARSRTQQRTVRRAKTRHPAHES